LRRRFVKNYRNPICGKRVTELSFCVSDCHGFGKAISYRLRAGGSGERRLAATGAPFKRARDPKIGLQELFL
jgi:hypothetical protein